MTFSILACDKRTGALGGAAATGNLCVGAWVLRARASIGVSASQGKSVSTLWGDAALEGLADGLSAQDALDRVIQNDPGREFRQLSVLGETGDVAGWTGSENQEARGHLEGESYIIAGNWLTTSDVLREMEHVYKERRSDPDHPFEDCLLDCLSVGVDAGSDTRGTLSAALKVVHPDRPPLDLRVDLDDEPVARLRTLYQRSISPPYADWVASVPTLSDPYRN